jgi:hypothetical protein
VIWSDGGVVWGEQRSLVWTRTLQWYKQEGKEGVGMEMMRRHQAAAAGGMI